MNLIVVVKVKIRTNRLTVMARNLGDKTLVSSFAFNSLLALLFSTNIKKNRKSNYNKLHIEYSKHTPRRITNSPNFLCACPRFLVYTITE